MKEPEKSIDSFFSDKGTPQTFGKIINPAWATYAEQEIERARELLAKTMILLDLATGHGDDIDSLCVELRTEVELLRSGYTQEIERLRGLVKEQAEAIVVSFSAGEFNVCIFCGTEITHNAGFDANNKSFWKDTTTHDPTCIVLKSKAVLGEE